MKLVLASIIESTSSEKKSSNRPNCVFQCRFNWKCNDFRVKFRTFLTLSHQTCFYVTIEIIPRLVLSMLKCILFRVGNKRRGCLGHEFPCWSFQAFQKFLHFQSFPFKGSKPNRGSHCTFCLAFELVFDRLMILWNKCKTYNAFDPKQLSFTLTLTAIQNKKPDKKINRITITASGQLTAKAAVTGACKPSFLTINAAPGDSTTGTYL